MTTWCSACHDQFDQEHYDTEGFEHKVGLAFGPTGYEMLALHLLHRIMRGGDDEHGSHVILEPSRLDLAVGLFDLTPDEHEILTKFRT